MVWMLTVHLIRGRLVKMPNFLMESLNFQPGKEVGSGRGAMTAIELDNKAIREFGAEYFPQCAQNSSKNPWLGWVIVLERHWKMENPGGIIPEAKTPGSKKIRDLIRLNMDNFNSVEFLLLIKPQDLTAVGRKERGGKSQES